MKKIFLCIFLAVTVTAYGQTESHGKLIKKTERQDGDTKRVYEEYEDGYYCYTSTSPCHFCKRKVLGECIACDGTGISPASNMFIIKCPLCGGNGVCSSCKGKGEWVSGYSGNFKDAYFLGGGYNPGGSSHSGSGSNSKSNSRSSTYSKCTSCSGTGVCRGCYGSKGSWQDTGYYTGNDVQSWINCGMCGGSGRCTTCFGRGSIR